MAAGIASRNDTHPARDAYDFSTCSLPVLATSCLEPVAPGTQTRVPYELIITSMPLVVYDLKSESAPVEPHSREEIDLFSSDDTRFPIVSGQINSSAPILYSCPLLVASISNLIESARPTEALRPRRSHPVRSLLPAPYKIRSNAVTKMLEAACPDASHTVTGVMFGLDEVPNNSITVNIPKAKPDLKRPLPWSPPLRQTIHADVAPTINTTDIQFGGVFARCGENFIRLLSFEDDSFFDTSEGLHEISSEQSSSFKYPGDGLISPTI